MAGFQYSLTEKEFQMTPLPDLDQSGQQSDPLDKVMYNFSFSYENVRTIADEMEKLANNLPE